MTEKVYKLPLDDQLDQDLIDWINSFPRNKKAEVVRHALRFYKSQLKEGEVFIMPSGSVAQDSTVAKTEVVAEDESRGKGKRPKAGIFNMTKQGN